jgi:hypothetical protein
MLDVLTPKEARARGYKPLAGPYDLASPDSATRRREQKWWNTISFDLCDVDAVAVEIDTGKMEAWRHKDELIEITDE